MLTRTRPGNSPSSRFAHGEHVHAINCFGRNIENGAARFWITSGRHVLACGEFAIAVVLANKYDRQPPNRRHIHGFEQQTLV